MTRKWSWRHRKFHKIRYIGFLKKLTRCEYELSRPSRSRETAADVIFTFHKFFTNFWKKFFMFVLISQCHAELFPRTQKYTNQRQNGFTWKFLIFYLHCWENLQKSASVSYQIQDFLTKNFWSTVKDRNFIHEVCKWEGFFEKYWCNIF